MRPFPGLVKSTGIINICKKTVFYDNIHLRITYSSSDFYDELAWAAAWLYKATGENDYLDTAKELFDNNGMCGSTLWFSWDDKKAGAQVLMAEITGDSKYEACVTSYVSSLDYGTYTPKGLLYVNSWGSNRYAANNAHLCAQVAKCCIDKFS